MILDVFNRIKTDTIGMKKYFEKYGLQKTLAMLRRYLSDEFIARHLKVLLGSRRRINVSVKDEGGD